MTDGSRLLSGLSELEDSLSHLERLAEKRRKLGDLAAETTRQILGRSRTVPLTRDEQLLVANRVRLAIKAAREWPPDVMADVCDAFDTNVSEMLFAEKRRCADPHAEHFYAGLIVVSVDNRIVFEPDSLPFKGVQCVYALFEHDDLVYIGQSTQVRHRIRTHLKGDKPNVTRWAALTVPGHMSVNDAERDLIKRFAPSMNKVHNPQWVR